MESEAYLRASRAPLLQGVMWTMAIVPLMFVPMRLYVRVVLKRVFGWDDLIIVIATVSLLFSSATYFHAARNLILSLC